MKKIVFLIGFVVVAGFSAKAQDLSKIDLSSRPADHLMIQFGADKITGAPDSIKTSGFSRHFNIYMMYDKPFKPNTKYSVAFGGGLGTNLGTNVINQVGTVTFYVNGPSETTNSAVINSLRCVNVTAAVGGAGSPSLEEIRNYVSFNFAAQKRAVTVQDYESLIRNMPAQFGAPAKVSITENDNKILIQLLSYDTSGKLTNMVSNTLRQNIANYLLYRSYLYNDYHLLFLL